MHNKQVAVKDELQSRRDEVEKLHGQINLEKIRSDANAGQDLSLIHI